ncbi:PiggyBac transposable element-derived protein 4 [Elysia marginata]|uniref:PiggyBac transposable element-derived protein 4 n=1 Tax=Elysia marginata TaxID=1093978 RepID=A0AAV4HZM5_9GAST|nr:PiggyBac transposable element-derived protein 4 [Elysia marginata]
MIFRTENGDSDQPAPVSASGDGPTQPKRSRNSTSESAAQPPSTQLDADLSSRPATSSSAAQPSSTQLDADLSSRQAASSRSSSTNDEDWCSNLDGFPNAPTFTASPGLHIPESAQTPADFFSLLFDNEMLKHIKSESNTYASSQIHQATLKPHSLFKKWKKIKLEDIKVVFFCILVYMSLVPKKEIADYWSTEEVDKSTFASKILSSDRFMQILLMLHLNDNKTFIRT